MGLTGLEDRHRNSRLSRYESKRMLNIVFVAKNTP